MLSHKEFLKVQLNNPDFEEEYKALEPQYALARAVISARIQRGMSQQELAHRVGTSQANISKIERGNMNPSIKMAQRIADSLGKELKISFV
jgi:DNA-binding XRE family transcriptional regulator